MIDKTPSRHSDDRHCRLLKCGKYGSQTQRSHTRSPDSPYMYLSNNSPTAKRVSIPGRPFSL